MTLRMWARPPGESWDEVDLSTFKAVNFKLNVSYSHAATLTWTMRQPQHELPIPRESSILFVDTDYDGGTAATPVFEGHVQVVSPGEFNEVHYTAYDPTYRCAQRITVMSGPHANAKVVPRAVWNAKIDTDDDYAFEIGHDHTIGDIIEDILANAYNELVSFGAAPHPTVGGPAYVSTDLTALDLEPQEKVVFESEGLRSAIDRLMAYYPQYRIIFIPGPSARKWRIRNVLTAPAVTLTLNDHTASHVVLSLDLTPSMEKRATAVKVYGPPVSVFMDIRTVQDESSSGYDTAGGGLTELWTLQEELNFNTLGPNGSAAAIGQAGRQWQVTDEDKRLLARLTPEEYDAPVPMMRDGDTVRVTNWVKTRKPVFCASWDYGATWEPLSHWRMNTRQGIITVPGRVFRKNESNEYVLPNGVRFFGAYFDEPLSVRYPTSGYSGTAYTEASLEHEMKYYDESLAIGYEHGTPVTTAARSAQFTKLARNIQEAMRDIAYAGGATLHGIDYQWVRLNRRVNFAAVDKDGDPETTGWESINAVLTDVEYDYEQQLTTLTFNSDHLEWMNTDPGALKEMLKIRTYDQIEEVNYTFNYGMAAASATTRRRFRYIPQRR